VRLFTQVEEVISRLELKLQDVTTTPPQRLDLGNELERLGDYRSGVGVTRRGLPDIDWVEIPAGQFQYQGKQPLELPTFWMSRYPITNRQYHAFIDDGGYQEPTLWRALLQPRPKFSRWFQGNRPRTNVCWFEAVAFTRWLNTCLGLPLGAIRLPTEAEWEKAAGGEESLIYPWGNDYRSGFANVDETYQKDGPWSLGQTTAVGLYPHGRSPYGVADLAGNVWEWCLNRDSSPGAVGIDSSLYPLRVSRGGCWKLGPDYAANTRRFRSSPWKQSEERTFRLMATQLVPNRRR